MSKLKERYLKCKKEDKEKLYLFESGIFYLFLGEDAIKMSEKLNLKLGHLTNELYKCGFPKSSIEKYKELFELNNLNVEILDKEEPDYTHEFCLKIIDNIKNIDINHITPLDSMKLLKDIQDKL